MRAIFAIFACVFCVSTAQAAEWSTDISGAGSGKPLHVAGITAGDYTLGLRCRGDHTEIVYLTSEPIQDDQTVKLMNRAGVKLNVRVDRGQVAELPAIAGETGGNLSIIVQATPETFDDIKDAKTVISIAVAVIGRKFHEKRFDVRGASDAISKIMQNCGVN